MPVFPPDFDAAFLRTALGRYVGLTPHHAPGGTPMLDGHCAAWFEYHNRSRYIEGDQVIMVRKVERCGHSGEAPLAFHAGGFDLTPASVRTGRKTS